MLLLKLVTVITLFLATALTMFAEGTRTWEQSKYEDLVKGTSHGVAISSDGTLQLAPAFKLVASTPSSAVWGTAVGPHGELYAATGAPARVYRIVPGAQPAAIFQPQELQVQALVVDKDGVLYAATNPDGKVYKIERKAANAGGKEEKSKSEGEWSSSVYFDPGTKYIWGLALDGSGNLYVATGDHGQIFRVTASGSSSTARQRERSPAWRWIAQAISTWRPPGKNVPREHLLMWLSRSLVQVPRRHHLEPVQLRVLLLNPP